MHFKLKKPHKGKGSQKL